MRGRKPVRHEALRRRSKPSNNPDGRRPPRWCLPRPCRTLQYHWHKQKPHYVVLFSVVEPKSCAGNRFSAHLDCSPRSLWRFNWFLRDFGYDLELLSRNEIDDRHLIGLCGVVKLRRNVVNGASLLLLDGFAPQQEWTALSGEMEQRISTRSES